MKKVLDAVKRLGPVHSWVAWPGGWRDDIEAALVDAVFSARAVYRTRHGGGVHADVVEWRAGRLRSSFSLDLLCAEIDRQGIETWAVRCGNRQWSPGRPLDAPGGPSKAAAVREAAGTLVISEVAVRLEVSEVSLDHAIWGVESDAARR